MPDLDVAGRGVQPKKIASTKKPGLATILRRLNDSVPFRTRHDLASFVNWKGNAAFPIHRWLHYREAYSPHLIDKLSLGDKILDPFCGCGSILIGAAQSGYTSAGIDVNPLAIFAARVKLNPLSKPQIRSLQAFADGLTDRLAGATPWPTPGLAIAGKVFEPDILDTLLRIRNLIESEYAGDKGCRDFLHLAWVAILERVGSYFKEGNGIKYRNKKRLKTGYIRCEEGQWQLDRFGPDQKKFVLDAYLAHLRMMLQDTRHWKKGRWTDQLVIEGNVLEMDQLLARRKFNSIVFSPPYANRFDYFESMKVELWFGGFVNSYEANNQLRKVSLRSHLGADLNRAYEPVEPLEKLIELMDQDASSWRMGVADLLRGYFDDMRLTLKHCRKLLGDGHCYIVVGNSAFAGVIIPTDVLLARIGLECGFSKSEILVTRHLTVAPQQRNQLASLEDNMRESVVVLSDAPHLGDKNLEVQPSLFEDADPAPSLDEASDLFRELPRFPPFGQISNGDLYSLSLTNNTAALTHGLHRFAAKYIPQIPAWVMEEFGGPDATVLDPFCGSGTTLVEALHRCRKSIGIDCDPLACLIASAKTADVQSARIRELGEIIREKWQGPAEPLELPMPGLVNFTHWIPGSAWGILQSLMATIQALDCSEDERRFLLCVFSSVIRWVSNADDQTQKTYVSGTLKKKPPTVPPTFWKAFDRALTGLRQLERYRLPRAKARVIQGDAGDIQLPEASIDLVVTSPPYLDSVDYMYNFMLEYFWLGPLIGVKDRETFNRMRRGVIGAKNPLEKKAPHLPACLNDLISEGEILPARLPATLTYCHNMARHFASAVKVMKPKARYVLVIGNSQTQKGVLPIHDSLIRLAADAGLAFEKAFAYRIRRHYMKFPRKGRGGIITMDWVIVMKKTSVRASYPDRLPLPDFTLRHDEVAN